MNATILLLIIGAGVLLLTTILFFALWLKAQWRKWSHKRTMKKMGSRALHLLYIPKSGSPRIIVAYVGTQHSDSAIKIEEEKKAFLYDPTCVYKFDDDWGIYAGHMFSMYVHNCINPIKLSEGIPAFKGRKTPDEFYAALETKVFKELMDGIKDNMKGAIVIILIIVVIAIATALIGKQQGWF